MVELLPSDIHQEVVVLQEVGPKDWDEERPKVSSSVGLDGDLGPPEGGDAGAIGSEHVVAPGSRVVHFDPWI